MKYINFTFPLILFLALSSCSTTDSKKEVELEQIPSHFTTIQVDSSITFSYPSEMRTADNLNYESKFQFSDLINVQYAVVQENDRVEEVNLKTFSIEKLKNFQEKMVEPSSSKLTAFQLNEINGYEINFEADSYGWPSKLVYWISIVESKRKYITTIAWTTKDRKGKFQKDAELIVKSFRK